MWTARLRGEGKPRHPQDRGAPAAPWQPGAELSEGACHAQSGQQPRPHPEAAQARGQARGGPVGGGHVGRGARRHRRSHPRRDPGGQARRGGLSRGASRGGRVHRAGHRGMGGRRPQLAHQCMLGGRARGLLLLDGHGPPEPRLRAREVHPAHVVAPRIGPLLQPACTADSRRQAAGHEGRGRGHAAVQHGFAGGHLALAYSRHRGGHAARHGEPPDSKRSV